MSTAEELEKTLVASGRPVDVDDERLTLADEAERYELRRTLGQGGMGSIELRYDKRIGRELALKQIRAEALGHPGTRTRFLREARVQGQLDHPAVVPVFDLGQTGGAPFFTMRRIHGATLEEAIRLSKSGDPAQREKFGRRRLLTAFVSAALAIDYAHTRGVLHRDLKPSNVMLGDFGEVYVLDWGVAKVLSSRTDALEAAPVTTPPSGTEFGQTMGTLGYMSPEQLRGDVTAVGPLADVYALGAVLFEILAGTPLHPRTNREALVASTLSQVDARPSARPGAQDVPVELDEICSKATALFPADRYQSARELATAVERYLDGDRDLERRRALALQHWEAARHLAGQMHDGGRTPQQRVDVRAQALRELGQALIYDPTATEAMRTLIELTNQPPGELPKELESALAESTERGRRTVSTVGALIYAFGILMFGFTLFSHPVRSFAWAAALLVSVLVATFFSAWARRRTFIANRPPPLFLSGVIVVTLTTGLFGPLFASPMFAMMNMVAWSIHASGWRRWVGNLASLGSWLVPYGLEVIGVVSPTYYARDGEMMVHGRVFGYLPSVDHLFLLVSALSVSVSAALMVGRFRDLRAQAELQRGWAAWQLRQLVAEG